MRRSVFLDHNSTTPLRRAALEAMRPHLERFTANPSSVHSDGRAARAALDSARRAIAERLGARADEIVFTSGGTESNNLAIFGILDAAAPGAFVTSPIEHPCITRAADVVEARRREVIRVAPTADGTIEPAVMAAALARSTRLVSIQTANHELGTIQPVHEIAALAKRAGAIVHTDAVQAIGKIPIDVGELGVDLLSISAHKIGGPPGIGALFVRRATPLSPLLAGGAQEFGIRPGTVPVALAVGFAAAMDEACAEIATTAARQRELRRRLVDAIRAAVPDAVITSRATMTLQNTVNVAFPGADREALLIGLDLLGVSVSAGAACASGAVETSPVLRALPIDPALARSAIRISMGSDTNDEDLHALVDALLATVPRARAAR